MPVVACPYCGKELTRVLTDPSDFFKCSKLIGGCGRSFKIIDERQAPVLPPSFGYQVKCSRHGVLYAWTWTPGDTRLTADFMKVHETLAKHKRSRLCFLSFTKKVVSPARRAAS